MSDILITTGTEFCPALEAAAETFHMDEERFRAFYDRTSRQLWAYLSRLTGDRTAADDLVQEAYYRLLRVKLPDVSETHLKAYLFRIATNLVRDEWRQKKNRPMFSSSDDVDIPVKAQHHHEHENRSILERAMSKMKPREREILLLAYVEGSSHREISEVSGLKENSVRPLLLRARRKLAGFLRGGERHV